MSDPTPIPGSRLYREHCKFCGEPIRVLLDRVGKENYCTDCDEEHKTPAANEGLTSRQRHKLK